MTSGLNIPKILVVSSHTSSLFWFRLDMMKGFVSAGYEVVALGQDPESDWADKFAEHNIRYRQLYVERNGMNPFKDLKTLKMLNDIFKEEKPDKIFCYQAKTIIYTCLAARKNKIKEVYPLIAGLGSIFRSSNLKGRLVRLIMLTEYKVALRNAKKIIFQNNDDLSTFVKEKIVNPEKCCIINGSGVDLEKFKPMPMPDNTAFLMICRLIKDKGIIEYLEACRIIRKEYPSVRCLLVGPFDTNPSAITPEELKQYIDDGTIEYFGEQDDIRPYIEQSSVFVLPSYHEGTPKTVLENMAAARAIITTDAPGCRETVTDGLNGWLVPTKNITAVAEKMKIFILDPMLAETMGAEGRHIAEEKYDVKKVNESINSIINL